MRDTKPPATPTVRNKWTPREEAGLIELQQRKARIMAEARAPIADLLVTMPSGEHGYCEDHIEWFVANAEALRDALEPFDSMVRATAS